MVLVRPSDGADARWETYLLRRSSQSPVLADLWVFPGGTVRPDDRDPRARSLSPAFTPDMAHTALARPPSAAASTPEESYSYFVAAARELLEEAGVVLSADGALGTGGSSAAGSLEASPLADQRQAIEQGRSLAEVVVELGMRFDLGALTYYAHWITPEPLPQRFDTRFFLAELPAGQVASPSPFEMAEGIWIDVPTALDRAREGTLALHFATLNHLRRLAPFTTIDELLAFARIKAVVPVMPSVKNSDGRITPFLEPDLRDAW